MNLPTLTEKGKTYAIGAVFVVACGVFLYFAGRRAGALAAETAADTKVAQAQHAATLKVVAAARQLDAKTRALEAAVAATRAPHVVAIARSDTADTIATHFRHDAEHLAHDSSATRAQLVAAIDSVARADSLLELRRVAERTTAMNRIVALEALVRNDSSALALKDAAIASQTADYAALEKVVTDLRGQQHGFLHRLTTGVVTGAAAAGCYVAGTALGGPPVGALAAIGCAGAIGAWSP